MTPDEQIIKTAAEKVAQAGCRGIHAGSVCRTCAENVARLAVDQARADQREVDAKEAARLRCNDSGCEHRECWARDSIAAAIRARGGG